MKMFSSPVALLCVLLCLLLSSSSIQAAKVKGNKQLRNIVAEQSSKVQWVRELAPTDPPGGGPGDISNTPPPNQPTAPSPSPKGPPCFSALTKVMVKNVGLVSLLDLVVGSQILTNVETQKYETVYAMGHYHTGLQTQFLQLEFTDSKVPKLEVTGSHFVYLKDSKRPKRADMLMEGDVLESTEGDESKGSVIKSIGFVTRKGIFSPLTASGKVVVNGNVLASTYTDYEPATSLFGPAGLDVNQLQHSFVAPFRFYCTHVTPNSDYCLTYSDEGIPKGLEMWKDFFDTAAGQDNFAMKALYLVAFFMVAVFFWAAEMVVATPLAVWIALLGLQRVFMSTMRSKVQNEMTNAKVQAAAETLTQKPKKN